MRAIRHTGIVVSNLDKMLSFYRDILGLKISREMDEGGEYLDNLIARKKSRVKTIKMSADNGDCIELLCFSSPRSRGVKRNIYDKGYSHISFSVDNLDGEYRRLRRAKVKFNSLPQVSRDGCAKVVFCRDPEGNFIELVQQRI